jgi:hypothetical protein
MRVRTILALAVTALSALGVGAALGAGPAAHRATAVVARTAEEPDRAGVPEDETGSGATIRDEFDRAGLPEDETQGGVAGVTATIPTPSRVIKTPGERVEEPDRAGLAEDERGNP